MGKNKSNLLANYEIKNKYILHEFLSKKNGIDQYIKLESTGIIHHQQLITPQTENEEAQACAKQSEENDSLEQQLKDAQYTLTESENK